MALNVHKIGNSSSSSGSNRRIKYHVFLSFRGDDTRKCFTDHLNAALKRDGLIITFRDVEDLERGEDIKTSLLGAIEESFSAVVVLSKNYANSTWCLDELLKILHAKKELGLHIFPIFYDVDPSDVRKQIGPFEQAFKQHENKVSHDKVQRWRDAFTEVGRLAGWNSQDYSYEAKLIKNVVEDVWSKLHDQPLDLSDEGLVGIDAKITSFNSLLADTIGEVQFIGIWGMGGSGKTTLARVVYERVRKNYDVHFFLHKVREESTKDGGIIKLQTTLISHPIRGIRRTVDNCYEGREFIERMLCRTKVLLVLDDVSEISQLEILAGKERWFGKGSTIIITTRDRHLLVEYGVVSQYEMSLLSHNESLQLFLQVAFKGSQPHEDYLELSEKANKFAKGLPLATKVFGSFLCGRSLPEWEDALKKIPSSNDIFNTLKVSFDGLEDNEKNIFLDIACFFNGMHKDYVIQILENIGRRPVIGISVLIEKSMLTEDHNECLRVHDMLEEMGKKIVICESPNDAGKRSRIWSLEDAKLVLENFERGTEAILGIAIRFDKPFEINLDTKAFTRMSNLTLLIISNRSRTIRGQLNLLERLAYLPNRLKVIVWDGYPLDFLPSQTQLDELVHIKMQQCGIKELWRRTKILRSLKFIDLSNSTNLISTPDLNTIPNLQRLILKGCTKLVDVHSSLGQHKSLVIVSFEDCKSVETLPTKLEMSGLETFVLSGCSKLNQLPEFGKGMERLSKLDLKGIAISELPQSLIYLTGLAILNLRDCKNLVCFPRNFQKLKAMKEIDVRGCSKFSRLPENLNENEALEVLFMDKTAIIDVPSSPNNLKNLSFMGCKNLMSSSTKLLRCPSYFSNLSSLVWLNLSYCTLDDRSLPREIGYLSSLKVLCLSGNNFIEFPSGLISKLGKLEFITFYHCPKLQSLPQFPSNLLYIDASDCPLLEHYVREKQLWEFVEQFEFQTQDSYWTKIVDAAHSLYHLVNDWRESQIIVWDSSQVSNFFMQPTRTLTITGSEVPPWFHYQNYIRVEDYPYKNNVSFKVELPDSWSSSEWWGIAVCLVLEHDLESPNSNKVGIFWSDGDKNESKKLMRGFWTFTQSSCHHQQCIIHIRCTSFFVKQLEMVFFLLDKDGREKSRVKVIKCGWRVLCKEDVERWQDTRDEEECGSSNIGRPQK